MIMRLKKNIVLSICVCFLCSLILNISAEEGGRVLTVPTFNSCGVYFNPPVTAEWHMEYSRAGEDDWKITFPLVKAWEKNELRGSIVNLKENQKYKLRIWREYKADFLWIFDTTEREVFESEFTTWNPNPQVAKVIELDENSFDGGLIIKEQGRADAWIKYIVKKGSVLDAAKGKKERNAAITLKDAKYVILEGLILKGGREHSISVSNSKHIRIINCDLSNWGQVGKQDLYREGKYYTPNGKLINGHSGVRLRDSAHVVVERCYIHDPNGHANSWRYAHPTGPTGLTVTAGKDGGNYVIRYNDIIGSQRHRWNDAIMGGGNAYPNGGLARDSDVCGNMIAFANDDGIELDGGQRNIRVWGNMFQMTLTGTSTGASVLGPSYIWRNLIVNLGDEDGIYNTAFKNSIQIYARGKVHFFNNTLIVPESGGYGGYNKGTSPFDTELKGTMRNNLFICGAQVVHNGALPRKNDFDYDLLWTGIKYVDKLEEERLHKYGLEKHGVFAKPEFIDASGGNFTLTPESPGKNAGIAVPGFIDNFNGEAPDIGAFESERKKMLPYRPIPVSLDKSQINFKLSEESDFEQSQKVTVTIKGAGAYAKKFSIRKNEAFDWFVVSPTNGELKSGESLELKISLVKKHLGKMGNYKGVFLVRQEDGFSRPVTVFAHLHDKPKPSVEDGAILLEAENHIVGKLKRVKDSSSLGGAHVVMSGPRESLENSVSFDFEIPKSGDYLIDVRIKSDLPVGSHDSMFFSLDGDKKIAAFLRSSTNWTWALLKIKRFPPLQHFKLSKGKHSIKFYPRESIYFDALKLVLTKKD